MRLKKAGLKRPLPLHRVNNIFFLIFNFRKEVLSEQSFETNNFILSKSKTVVSERLQNLREGLIKKCIMDFAFVPRRYGLGDRFKLLSGFLGVKILHRTRKNLLY